MFETGEDNVVRVTSGGKMRNYISYALKKLTVRNITMNLCQKRNCETIRNMKTAKFY